MRASVAGEDAVTWGTPAARWILLATVLASGMAFSMPGTVLPGVVVFGLG